jgi:hypothetical protein
MDRRIAFRVAIVFAGMLLAGDQQFPAKRK